MDSFIGERKRFYLSFIKDFLLLFAKTTNDTAAFSSNMIFNNLQDECGYWTSTKSCCFETCAYLR